MDFIRCEMTITVLCFNSRFKLSCIFLSFSISKEALISSNNTIGASFKIARAIEILCRSPPDNLLPFSPIIV